MNTAPLDNNDKNHNRHPALWLLVLLPFLALPFIINTRIFPFVAPNEEPKWAILTAYGLLSGLALAAWLWFEATSRLRMRLGISGLLLTLFYLILTIGVFIGANPVEGAIRYAFWVFSGLVWLVAIRAIRHTPGWMNLFCWASSLSALAFSFHYWWNYILDYGKPGYNYSVLFSPIGHVNFTGDALIILLPALLWMLAARHNPIERVFNWFSSCTLFTILLIASSRGALGGMALSAMVFAVAAAPHLWRWHRQNSVRSAIGHHLGATAWVVSALVVAVVVYLQLPYHFRELGRVANSVEQAETVVEKQKVLTKDNNLLQPPLVGLWRRLTPLIGFDRTSMYASSSAMIADRPLLGHGTGNFAWLYPGYSNKYPDFRDPLSTPRTFTTNPHNIFLQMATQNGLPAALIFVGLLVGFWWALLRRLWDQWDGWLASGVVAMTAVIFDSMFNHVFYNPASMFVFALFGGAWWGRLFADHRPLSIGLPLPPRVWAAACLILVTALSVWPARWIMSEWHVGRAMALARQPAIASLEYDIAYRLDKDNFRALFGVAQAAYQRKEYDKTIGYLTDFERIYPYNPPALNMLGAAYMLSGKYPQAEAALQRALISYPGFTMAQQNLTRVQAILNYQKQQAKMRQATQRKQPNAASK
ncbi:MAG: O-antigen ligase family protein [Mariprofundales bacterium]